MKYKSVKFQILRWLFHLTFFTIILHAESLPDFREINGIVMDKDLETPLPDVNILAITGQDTTGYTTDNGGRFSASISTTKPTSLSFSHIGYESSTQIITSSEQLTILLIRKPVQVPVISVVGASSLSNLQVKSSVFKIDQETIEKRGFRNLEQSLLSESSVVIQRNWEGRETVSIRGSNSNEVGVFVDGVLMNAPFNGIADLSGINLYDISDLEVVKGGGSNLFGMGFFGGIINMKTKFPDRNGFSARYGGSTVFSNDRDQFQHFNIVLKRIAFTFRNMFRTQPLTPNNLYTNHYRTAGITTTLPTGKLNLKWFDQTYRVDSQYSNPFVVDSTTHISLQYLGDIPYLGNDWQTQLTMRSDRSSDNYWEVAGMNQLTKDRTQHWTIMKGFDKGGFSTIFLAEKDNKYFKGTSEFDIDDVYHRETSMDIDQFNSAFAFTVKFITGDLANLIDQVTIEAGLRYEDSDIELFKTDDHQISGGYSNSRIDTTLKSMTRTLTSRKIGMNMEGRQSRLSYNLFTNMGKDMRSPLLEDIYNIEATPIVAYQGNTLIPEILTNFELGYQFIWYRDDALGSEISFSGNIFNNQFLNKTYYEYVVASPPIPVQTDEAKINGHNVRISWGIFDKFLEVSYDETRLDINDTRSFPAKPSYRQTADLALNWKIFSLNYQHFVEGEQYLPGTTLNYLTRRENAHLSAGAKMMFSDLKITLTYRLENLMSKKGELADDFMLYLPANYFLGYNEYVSLQVTYPAR